MGGDIKYYNNKIKINLKLKNNKNKKIIAIKYYHITFII